MSTHEEPGRSRGSRAEGIAGADGASPGRGSSARGQGVELDVRMRSPVRGVEVRARFRPGVTTAVLGPNGAGKSTLLGMVSGTVRGEGAVRLGGRDLAGVALHRRRVTHLAQDPTVFEHMSVLGNAVYGLRSQGASRRTAEERARELLAAVGLADLEARRASRLSGGQAQRLALARALATDPDAVLLDEPFSALDVAARGELRSLVARLLTGRTALLVTHDLLDVLALADDVLVLEDGRVRQHGPRAAALERPRSPFLAQLLGLALTAGRAGERCVRTDGGLELPTAGAADPAVGSRVHVLLDPARISLAPHAQRGGGAGERAGNRAHREAAAPAVPEPSAGAAEIAAEVHALDRTGADLLVRCGELCARVPLREAQAHPVPRPGARVRLRVPPEAVRIYPEEDEREPAP